MSLPPAPKDIGEKPVTGAVTDPVNKADMDADIDRKIRLYGVISAFRQGKTPSNAQIDSTLKYVLANSPVDTSKLSLNGQKLISDFRDIIETARIMVQKKNQDELFQHFIWHTREVDIDTSKINQTVETAPVTSEKAKHDGKQAISHLRTLLSLILTNSEARKLLSDFSLIGRDLLAKGVSKAVDIIKPDDEALAQVDDAAPHDEFVEGGDASKEVERIKEKGSSAKSQAQEEAKAHTNDIQDLTNGSYEEKKRGLADRIRGVRDELSDRIPQHHKDKAIEQYERGKTFLTEELFPEERRDQFIYRVKKVIIECQKHGDYQGSLRWLLSFVKEYAKHGRAVGEHGKETGSDIISDPALKQATSELRTLLERFANGQSLNIIIDAGNALIDDAERDQELKGWFSKVDDYIHRVFLQPGYVLEPQCNTTGTGLREEGRQFFDVKYKDHFDNLFSSIGEWFKAMGNDPLNKRFGEDWGCLTRDILFDAEGSLKFKSDLWNDIRQVIMPTLIDKVGYIPIPRIEYTDDTLDLVLENLTLSGRNLFPNIVSFEANNFVKFSPYNAIKDESHHEFTFTFAQIQADMRDVAFYFKRKSGMPKLSDSGLADIILGGQGLMATVHLVSADKDKSSVFKVKNVHVKVDTLKFSVRDSKHDFLYKVVKPLAIGLVKKQIQKAFAGAITTGFEYIDGQLVGVRDRLDEAKATEGDSRMKALQELFSRKTEEVGSVKSHDKASHFKVVSNKRQSILANQGHPVGWVNRTTERDEKASQGQEWRSEAFTIV